jgi:L-asparagine transporter-like permease
MRASHGQDKAGPHPARYWLVLVVFLILVVVLLWKEHQAHLIGALPWVLILVLCPLMHVFMHGGHSTHRNQDKDD